jgi:hypothetical protein
MKTLLTFAALAVAGCASNTNSATSADFVGTWTWTPNNVENITCGMNPAVDQGPMGTFAVTVSGDTVTMNGGPNCSIELTLDPGGLSASSGSTAGCATDPAGATDVQYMPVPAQPGSGTATTPGYSLALGNDGGNFSGLMSVFMNGTGTFMGQTGCTILSGDAIMFGTIAMVAANEAAIGAHE